jgi:hypothetical protein
MKQLQKRPRSIDKYGKEIFFATKQPDGNDHHADVQARNALQT